MKWRHQIAHILFSRKKYYFVGTLKNKTFKKQPNWGEETRIGRILRGFILMKLSLSLSLPFLAELYTL